MIDISLEYKTQSGCPVRNLHWDMFSIDGEYYLKGNWHDGSWTDNGRPAVLTTDKEFVTAFSLVEVPEEKVYLTSKQCEFNFII